MGQNKLFQTLLSKKRLSRETPNDRIRYPQKTRIHPRHAELPPDLRYDIGSLGLAISLVLRSRAAGFDHCLRYGGPELLCFVLSFRSIWLHEGLGMANQSFRRVVWDGLPCSTLSSPIVVDTRAINARNSVMIQSWAGQRTRKCVIWEIILRAFWGAILRVRD
jgi:hypothetical protein